MTSPRPPSARAERPRGSSAARRSGWTARRAPGGSRSGSGTSRRGRSSGRPSSTRCSAFRRAAFPGPLEAWSSQVHPDDVDGVVAALDLHLKSGVPYDAAYRIRRADGEYVWWHDVGYAERDGTGRPFRMAGTCVDITERMKTEEAIRSRDTALRTSERWLEEAQRVGRLGWYSFHPGRGRSSRCSESVREILGIGA